MKKIVTTLLLSALTATSVLAFTACGGDEDPVYTVTADEWKKAFNYFNVDIDEDGIPLESNYARINFSSDCTMAFDDNGNKETYELKLSMDYNKKIMALEFTNDQGKPDEYYAWKDSDKCYSVGDGWHAGDENNELIYFYHKEEVDEKELPLTFDSNVAEYAGGRQINELDIVNKFSQFTYSEEKAEYTATLDYDVWEATCDVTAKLQDGKLISFNVKVDGNEYNFKYTYGITATVPDFYLNLPLGETVKPKN